MFNTVKSKKLKQARFPTVDRVDITCFIRVMTNAC